MTEFFTTHTGQQLAYSFTNGVGPTVIFLGGFKSDMEGSKAIFLENWAQKRKRSFLRFDYSGHGQSTGCLLYTSPSPRDISGSRMPSSA